MRLKVERALEWGRERGGVELVGAEGGYGGVEEQGRERVGRDVGLGGEGGEVGGEEEGGE